MVSDQATLDVAVIGGGILGLASARELLLRHPGLRVTVIEKEPRIAEHQTGHNSGVIHSGVYYAPGSLKARLCVEGAAALYRFAESRGIAHRRCGKAIVAVREAELPALQRLLERARTNGVEAEVIDGAALRRIEPHCQGLAALWVPGTGIIEYREVAAALAEEIVGLGGQIRCGGAVTAVREQDGAVALRVGHDTLLARQLVACAGLQADRVAGLSGGAPEPAVIPFRGDYWILSRPALVRGLIYPVPDPAFPFLGVHFTRRIDGSVWLGPNAVLALAREGYGRRSFRPRDAAATLAHRGFRTLARRYWRTGLSEMVRDLSIRALLGELRRFLPDLRPEDLVRGPSGVRAQALGDDGTLLDDFVFEAQGQRILHVRNAPSPAATSSLALARMIIDRADALAGR